MTCISEICPLYSSSKQGKSSVANPSHELNIYTSVNQLPFAWERLSQQTSIFLQKDYLQALERAAPASYQFFYLVFHYENKVIGIALAHYFPFAGAKGIRVDDSKAIWRQQVQRILLKQLNWNFLVIGNSTLTGEQGVYFSSAISPQAQLDLL
ncbi:MAG: hypothetical protein AAF847_19970, partial [Bacteroidota bacterium]